MIRTDNSDGGTVVQWAIAKALSLWALIGVSTWGEAASFIAFVYSLCLLSEWLYKKSRALNARWIAWRATKKGNNT